MYIKRNKTRLYHVSIVKSRKRSKLYKLLYRKKSIFLGEELASTPTGRGEGVTPGKESHIYRTVFQTLKDQIFYKNPNPIDPTPPVGVKSYLGTIQRSPKWKSHTNLYAQHLRTTQKVI